MVVLSVVLVLLRVVGLGVDLGHGVEDGAPPQLVQVEAAHGVEDGALLELAHEVVGQLVVLALALLPVLDVALVLLAVVVVERLEDDQLSVVNRLVQKSNIQISLPLRVLK